MNENELRAQRIEFRRAMRRLSLNDEIELIEPELLKQLMATLKAEALKHEGGAKLGDFGPSSMEVSRIERGLHPMPNSPDYWEYSYITLAGIERAEKMLRVAEAAYQQPGIQDRKQLDWRTIENRAYLLAGQGMKGIARELCSWCIQEYGVAPTEDDRRLHEIVREAKEAAK